MKKKLNISLKYQQILLSVIISILSVIIIIFILPIVMKPIYENNLYNLMEQSLYMKDSFYERARNEFTIISKDSNSNITIEKAGSVLKKDNYNVVEIMIYLDKDKGKISTDNGNYYYISTQYNNSTLYVISDDLNISNQQEKFGTTVFPIITIVIIVLVIILLIYNNFIIRKVKGLKENIRNINNKNYINNDKSIFIDELSFLNKSINEARNELINKEKQKNELFQQISHELKTPLMVISNHFDALKDKIINQKEAYEIIEEEIKKLNDQISLILQLTKYESIVLNNSKEVDLSLIIDKQVDIFKKINNKLNWNYDLNNLKYGVNEELWNMVVSNLLSNFVRYAKKNIDIYIEDKKIIFKNDGKNIEEKLIKKVFEPYVKSSDGKSGLGLYIVKSSLELNNYSIKCQNNNKEVMFIIEKK